MDITRWIPNHQDLVPSLVGGLGSVLCKLKQSFSGTRAAFQNSDFGIEDDTGFLPSVPLERLPSTFDFWENALTEAQSVLTLGTDTSDVAIAKRSGGDLWRRRIREGPVIAVRIIQDDIRALQRAHLVLAFLVQFYVHSMPPSEKTNGVVVPKTLALPLVTVSDMLGIAPVLTYCDTVLWNLAPKMPELPISMDNMTASQLFSGTDDEEQFYIISAGVEIRGAEVLQIIQTYYMLPDLEDMNAIVAIAGMLTRVAAVIGEISDIIQSIRAGCDPFVFNYEIRHWLEGSDASGPTARRWVYEGIDTNKPLDLSGPSGGQSPIMHALDVWLDIDHRLAEKRAPAPSEENKRADTGFMQRMRRYMSRPQEEYLRYISQSSRPVREMAKKNPALREPYNNAVSAMKRLRDLHIRIACLYVISSARRVPAEQTGENESSGQRSRGTGGMEVSTLLKAGRDATKRAILPPSLP